MREEVILIFDVGKTNKKVLLFDRKLRLRHEEETRFEETVDDEGFPCDDAALLESWIRDSIHSWLGSEKYRVRGVNFASYGATLVFLDEKGKRITPIYNYLKPLKDKCLEGFYNSHGGEDEFCRKTASPALGMLNSGLQIRWLKANKPDLYRRVAHILHLPNYFSYLLSGQIASEHTSIGCHTAMWDFDKMDYHGWLKEEGVKLPRPVPVSETLKVKKEGVSIECGVGIHDSSSSLAPYLLAGSDPFLLISTGTWCISMNPFNPSPLTDSELKQDCLCYMAVNGNPVKSSRFFLGHIHDASVEKIEAFFKEGHGSYKLIQPEPGELKRLWMEGVAQSDLLQCSSYREAYAYLMLDLSRQTVRSVKLVVQENSPVKHIYLTGGFAKNPFFTGFLSLAFPDLSVFTSEVANATSLGAAIVIAEKVWPGSPPTIDLGLDRVLPTS